MGLNIEPTLFDGASRSVSYIRLDGLRLDARPERDASGQWVIPADRAVFVHLYGYADVEARIRGDAPIFDAMMTMTLSELGFASAGTDAYPSLATAAPQDIWNKIYDLLRKSHRHSTDDHAKLFE
jgi:hypothetical protein